MATREELRRLPLQTESSKKKERVLCKRFYFRWRCVQVFVCVCVWVLYSSTRNDYLVQCYSVTAQLVFLTQRSTFFDQSIPPLCCCTTQWTKMFWSERTFRSIDYHFSSPTFWMPASVVVKRRFFEISLRCLIFDINMNFEFISLLSSSFVRLTWNFFFKSQSLMLTDAYWKNVRKKNSHIFRNDHHSMSARFHLKRNAAHPKSNYTRRKTRLMPSVVNYNLTICGLWSLFLSLPLSLSFIFVIFLPTIWLICAHLIICLSHSRRKFPPAFNLPL